MKLPTQIGMLTILIFTSCERKFDNNSQNERQSSAQIVALEFINDYAEFSKTNKSESAAVKWIETNELPTSKFKNSHKQLLERARQEDEEMGLGFDPIFNAQDFPDGGFITSRLYDEGYMSGKGKNEPEFKVMIRMKMVNNKWMVDGAGVVNIPKNRQLDNSNIGKNAVSGSESDDFASASIYAMLDSDSLLADKSELARFLPFYRKGHPVETKYFDGGDCSDKLIRIALLSDTLVIHKYACGDYGFGNTEFVIHRDSLKYVRKYGMLWHGDDQGEFLVSENIYEFSTAALTKRSRKKPIEGWKDFQLNDLAFEKHQANETEYVSFIQELRSLDHRESLPE
jgi:hypothetical protein